MLVELLWAPFLIAAVLIVSGIAKLRDPGGVQNAFEDLRIPPPLSAPWIRRAFPWTETALGVLLVVAPGPVNVAVALATLALMGCYLALVWRAHRRPDPVDCHCFGSLATGRITWRTLARNVTLVLIALVALVDSLAGTPLLRAFDPRSATWLAALPVTAWLAYTIFADQPSAEQWQQEGEHPGPVQAAPEVSEEDLEYLRLPIPYGTLIQDGLPVTLRSLAQDRAVLLVWVSLTCGACVTVIKHIPDWVTDLVPVEVRPVFESLDGLADAAPALAPLALWDPDRNVHRLFDAPAIPMAVLLGADGQLAGGPVLGSDSVDEFVAQMRAQLAEAQPQDGVVEIASDSSREASVEALHAATVVDTGAPIL